MITNNMTAGNDNQLIWVIKIDLESSVWYFCDTVQEITLGSTVFDGKVIFRNSISTVENMCNIVNGGSFGQVGNFEFSLARWNSYSGISNFFNDLYPQTGKPLLTAKSVQLGYVWSGATSLTDITWKGSFYVQDYSFPNDSELKVICYAKDELSQKQIPYHVVQDDIENDISYFPDAPENNKGLPIPIIYGDFSTTDIGTNTHIAPCVKINEETKYKIASHECFSLDDTMYKVIGGDDIVLQLDADTINNVNQKKGASLELIRNSTSLLYGLVTFRPKIISDDGTVTDRRNAIDEDITTYAILQPGSALYIKIGKAISESNVGTNAKTANDVLIKFRYKTLTANDILTAFSTPTSVSDSWNPGDTAEHNDSWAIGTIAVNDLEDYEYTFRADLDNVGNIYIYDIYFELPNQNVYADSINQYRFINNGKPQTVITPKGYGLPKSFNSLSAFTTFQNKVFDSDVAVSDSEVLASVKGRMADIWATLGTRTTGLSTGDLLTAPALILESIIRDEICTEWDLVIDSISTADIVFGTTTPLNVVIDDYYNGAILVNATRDERYFVNDHDGSAYKLTLASTPSGWSAGDKCYLKNINCPIDITTFDVIQKRQIDDGWIFSKVINQQQSSQDILNQILFESFCMLIKSGGTYKLIDLTIGSYVGTLGTPMWEDGSALFSTALTPFENIYTDFVLNYGYDYVKKSYNKRIFVNKNGSSNVYLSSLEDDCYNAEINYKIKRKYEYNSDWINDDTTANYLMNALVQWFTYQRMIAYGNYECSPYLEYETGDRMKINYAFMIPTVKNNDQDFIVMNTEIEPTKKKIQFSLLY